MFRLYSDDMDVFSFNSLRPRNYFYKCTAAIFFLIFVSISFTDLYAQQQVETTTDSVHISKISTSSYDIADGSVSIVPYFDTMYTIMGNGNALNGSIDLITTTIINDFNSSPTIGYILVNTSDVNDSSDGLSNISNSNDINEFSATLANPFADSQVINASITQLISSAIPSANQDSNSEMAIKCDFGSNMKDWRCYTS